LYRIFVQFIMLLR